MPRHGEVDIEIDPYCATHGTSTYQYESGRDSSIVRRPRPERVRYAVPNPIEWRWIEPSTSTAAATMSYQLDYTIIHGDPA